MYKSTKIDEFIHERTFNGYKTITTIFSIVDETDPVGPRLTVSKSYGFKTDKERSLAIDKSHKLIEVWKDKMPRPNTVNGKIKTRVWEGTRRGLNSLIYFPPTINLQ